MTIEQQLELKREVATFYLQKFPTTIDINNLISYDTNRDLYSHLESKGLIPQGVGFVTFCDIVQQKLQWAIMSSVI